MNVINGMPAHALLLHFPLVLVPLTALLEVVCGLWPAARRGQLLWLTLMAAAVNLVLTPLTVNAGRWLLQLRTEPTPILREHAARGSAMIYFSVAMMVVAIVLLVLRLAERRSGNFRWATHLAVATLVLGVGIASMIQIYRVGDAGAQSVWGGELARLEKAHGN